jgi:hypothetical protein
MATVSVFPLELPLVLPELHAAMVSVKATMSTSALA